MGQAPGAGSIVATTPGSVVAGRYLVEKQLGEGGMATVLEVKDLRTERRLALKILKPEIAAHPEAVERFRREGEFLSSLRHPALIAVEAVGTLSDSRLFLAMELLAGETLGDRIRRGKLSPTEISPLLAGAAVGLDAAHRSGVIHRDLKPDNVFLSRATPNAAVQVKLLDFGISKIDGRASLTRTGQVLGTPRYMAPEQLRGEDDLDPRVDVYALGVILYEALAGAPAFPAQQPSDLIIAILNGKYVPLRAIRPDVPSELEAVVVRAMSKTREARFSSAVELAEAWFSVVHRNDGPKAVRVGVATNILGSVGDSLRPRSPFSTDELRPATFRDYEAARVHVAPAERPLADLVRDPALAAPEATSPAHVPSPAAAVRAATPVPMPVPTPSAAPIASPREPTPVPRSQRSDSDPPVLPTSRASRWILPVALGVAAILGIVAFAVSRSGTNSDAAAPADDVVKLDSGIRFIDVPIVILDAGVLADKPDFDAAAIGDSGTTTAAPDAPTDRPDTTASSDPSPVREPRDPRPVTDPVRTTSRDAGRQTTADPWTGSTDSTGATSTTGGTSTEASSAATLLARARAASASGDSRKCIEIASEAIAAGADASIYRIRGDCYRALGDAPHALRSYQRFCSLAPNSAQIAAVRRAAEALGGSCP